MQMHITASGKETERKLEWRMGVMPWVTPRRTRLEQKKNKSFDKLEKTMKVRSIEKLTWLKSVSLRRRQVTLVDQG